VRLHKYMAEVGVASRRACEQMILDGRVKVNGSVVDVMPVLIDPENDRILVDGRPLNKADRFIYVMLHKPRNTMSAVTDPSGRTTVTDLVQHPSGIRLYPVGRLDYDTTGLLLLTNDGELANRLTHPRYGMHKTYLATVKGVLSDENLRSLERGIFLAHRREGETMGARRTSGAALEFVKRGRPAERGAAPEGSVNSSIIQITLSEGRNRQVRRMLAQAGCHVKKLTRVQMGPLRLKGLALGHWRELTPVELRALRKAAMAPVKNEGFVTRPDADERERPRPALRDLKRKAPRSR
jgi:pseudouridine synthase